MPSDSRHDRTMSLQPGERLGPYRILGPLGAGGMGEVYRAQDTRLGREVAIKVLPEALRHSPDRMSRFEREARLLASINHPNIAAIYELEEWGSLHSLVLVLELVPGETLAKKISRGAVPWREALQIAGQIAEALEAAHAQGVVHRDLKPLNIMLTPAGKVKVLDFGLAKEFRYAGAAGDSSGSPTIEREDTEPGTLLGTSTYMSPEQARGKKVDTRCDIWAFGCVLYELLTGKKAFDGETLSDKIAAILMQEPDWQAIPDATPEWIRDLLRRCLEKEVARRLPSIGDARVLLEGASPHPARIPDSRPSMARLSQATRLVTMAAVGLALLAAAWFLFSPRLSQRPVIPDKKYLAVLPFKDLSGLPSGQLVGDGMVETLSARLSRVPEIHVVLPSAAVAAADRQSDPFRAARDLGVTLLVRGSVQRSGDRVRVIFSVWNAQQQLEIAGDTLDGSAADLFGMQDRLAEQVVGLLQVPMGAPWSKSRSTGLETADEQERYIRALGSLQRYDREASISEAIGLLTQLAAERPAAALVHAALGRACLSQFTLSRDKKWVDSANEACSRARQLNPDLPEVDATLGEIRLAAGQASEAIPAFQRALAAQPNNFAALLGLAAAYAAAGNPREAETTYRRAIALQPSYWAGYSKLGGFFFVHGNLAQAAEMFRRVIELAPDNARAFSNLGAAELLMGEFEAALADFKKSLALSPTNLAYSNIGTLEFYCGRYQAAAEAFESAARMAPGHYQVWANLGDAYRWAPGQQAKSGEAYARALTLAEGELKLNPKAGLVHSVVGLCLAKSGKLAQAEEHMRKALAIDAHKPEFLYHAAVVAYLAGRRKEALGWIQQAVQDGYSKQFLARDPELSALRNDPVFAEAIQAKGSP